MPAETMLACNDRFICCSLSVRTHRALHELHKQGVAERAKSASAARHPPLAEPPQLFSGPVSGLTRFDASPSHGADGTSLPLTVAGDPVRRGDPRVTHPRSLTVAGAAQDSVANYAENRAKIVTIHLISRLTLLKQTIQGTSERPNCTPRTNS